LTLKERVVDLYMELKKFDKAFEAAQEACLWFDHHFMKDRIMNMKLVMAEALFQLGVKLAETDVEAQGVKERSKGGEKLAARATEAATVETSVNISKVLLIDAVQHSLEVWQHRSETIGPEAEGTLKAGKVRADALLELNKLDEAMVLYEKIAQVLSGLYPITDQRVVKANMDVFKLHVYAGDKQGMTDVAKSLADKLRANINMQNVQERDQVVAQSALVLLITYERKPVKELKESLRQQDFCIWPNPFTF